MARAIFDRIVSFHGFFYWSFGNEKCNFLSGTCNRVEFKTPGNPSDDEVGRPIGSSCRLLHRNSSGYSHISNRVIARQHDLASGVEGLQDDRGIECHRRFAIPYGIVAVSGQAE